MVWPRRDLRVATSPAFRGRSIGRADGPDRASRGRFMKNPFKFSKINPRSRRSLRIFYKKYLVLFPNQRSVQTGWALVCLKKDLHFIENQLTLSRHSHCFLRKHPQIFLKSKYNLTLIIFFFSKKYVWPVDHAHGRARKTSNIQKKKE